MAAVAEMLSLCFLVFSRAFCFPVSNYHLALIAVPKETI